MILSAGTALVAAAGEFVHGRPGPRFRSFHAGTTLLIAGFDVGRLPFLLVGVAGFVALGHGAIFVWWFTDRSFIHGEADFDSHLPVMHFPLFNVATRFDHLKPPQVLDGFVRALNGLTHRVFNGNGGGAGEFDDFIDGVFHIERFRYSWVVALEMSAYLQPQAAEYSLIVFSTTSRVSPVSF